MKVVKIDEWVVDGKKFVILGDVETMGRTYAHLIVTTLKRVVLTPSPERV